MSPRYRSTGAGKPAGPGRSPASSGQPVGGAAVVVIHLPASPASPAPPLEDPMSLRRTGITGLFLGVLALLGALPAAADPGPSGVSYVAMGDSYSAGLGAGGSGDSCARTANAYPALWAAANRPAAFASLACSGATAASVAADQVSALPADTTLVSVTIGGNDVGFSTIMQTCALHRTSDCLATVAAAEKVARTALPGRLDALYTAISARAPRARVVVLGYPDFYRLHVWYCVGLGGAARAKIDEGIDVLDEVTATAAAAHGFTFVDVRPAFADHQLCSGHKWLHAVDFAHLTESYHPTVDGQSQGYLAAFTAAVGGADRIG